MVGENVKPPKVYTDGKATISEARVIVVAACYGMTVKDVVFWLGLREV